MRVRVQSGFIYQGRALEVGDEIDMPDSPASQKIERGQVTLVPPAEEQPTERTIEQSTVRDPIPQHRDPRPRRRRGAGEERSS